jgi:heterotetrameric sarcosine oxidase alpha subunit
VKLVGRSFKYHRPRGILTAGSEEPSALVTLRTGARAEPNIRATTTELYDGLSAISQNRWPSLSFDLMSINQLAAPLLAAGFYYKTFMWPAKLWEKLYEPVIRRAAGLGALSMQPDPDSYDQNHAFCDLLVIGAGPAGLAAALTAARSGIRVILAEEDRLVGGRLMSGTQTINGERAGEWTARIFAELRDMPNVKMLARTSIFGAYDGHIYGAIERVADHLPEPAPGQPRQCLWKIAARRALLATGAIERPLTFGSNDRPGVMMAGAVSTYLHRYAVAPGTHALVYTASDSGWETAAHLLSAGVDLAAVVDTRDTLPAASAALARAGVEILANARVLDAKGKALRRVVVRNAQGRTRTFDADLLAMSGGWSPAIGLGSNLGARPVWSEEIQAFVPGKMPPGMIAIGAAAGRFSLREALEDGVKSVDSITDELGVGGRASETFIADEEDVAATPLWAPSEGKTKAFVDFQHDVTDRDVALAAREGFVSVEHMKRYTTLGMATDQGKLGQLTANALLAQATDRAIPNVGTILSRPPYVPVAIGAFAGHHRGDHFRPERHTASHQWAIGQGATFADAGLWKRAQWFSRPGERDWLETVTREVKATRSGVGICDVSTLGKIDVHGPDAAKLLDRLYVNMFSTLPVGKARYGLMLREDGFVFDDGTTTRFAEDYFFMTTTTANAARVMQHIDYARQVLWPDLDVQATSVTEQWATYAVAGPQSRAVLQKMLPDIDLSNEAFPYMAACKFTWRGLPARLYRLSFSGELAYEVSVPAHQGEALLRELFAAGGEFDITPYGTEALGVMRIEKGHPAGNELSGQTTAFDLGMGRLLSRKKDFIGRVMANREALLDPARPQLVGIRPVDIGQRIGAGAHLINAGAAPVAANDQGNVSSVAYSPSEASWIGLALLRNGPERHGERLFAYDPVRGRNTEVQVCNPVFVDPEGVRVRG